MADWFEENQRWLPWRGETDPYKIWVSEVILQQTRVNQGWEYYRKFIDSFPDVKRLADAHQQDVLLIWQGLGYYSRARNLHLAAQQIVLDHQGIFPQKYLEIRKLKGIGNYTAAAIASIAFQLPYPAVDGNVLRVMTRIFGIYDDIAKQKTIRYITKLCEKLMDRDTPGNFNQALMEFGAIQCTPKNPKCETCPFDSKCMANEKSQTNVLPVNSFKPIIKKRYFHYFLFINNRKIIIHRRTAKDIWNNLFQFPMIETQTPCEKLSKNELFVAGFGKCNPVFLKEVIHKLTHQLLTIRYYIVNDYLPDLKDNWLLIPVETLVNYPFPVALKKIIHK